jgi:hypothetical protein
MSNSWAVSSSSGRGGGRCFRGRASVPCAPATTPLQSSLVIGGCGGVPIAPVSADGLVIDRVGGGLQVAGKRCRRCSREHVAGPGHTPVAEGARWRPGIGLMLARIRSTVLAGIEVITCEAEVDVSGHGCGAPTLGTRAQRNIRLRAPRFASLPFVHDAGKVSPRSINRLARLPACACRVLDLPGREGVTRGMAVAQPESQLDGGSGARRMPRC